MIARLVALLLVIAVIVAGVAWFEKREDGKQEKALRELAQTTKDVIWTDDNTIVLEGDTFGFDHRIESFLFVGTDASSKTVDKTGLSYGPMADFLLLMVIDHTNDSVGFLQIDRNTVTEVNELDAAGETINSRDLQICTAHWYGHDAEMSVRNTMDAVCTLLGELQFIDGYFVVSMEDIGRLNHAVGGVEVTITDDLEKADATLRNGETLVLSDDQAEAFLRARYGLENEDNVERMRRQRDFMGGFFSKIKEATLNNPKFGLDLYASLKDVAVTNMTGNDFSRIAQMLLKGEDKGIKTLRGKTIVGDIIGDGLGHEEFYPEEESIREVMVDLYSLVPVDDESLLTEEDLEEDADFEDEDLEDGEDAEDEEDTDDEEDLENEEDTDDEETDDEETDDEEDLDDESIEDEEDAEDEDPEKADQE